MLPMFVYLARLTWTSGRVTSYCVRAANAARALTLAMLNPATGEEWIGITSAQAFAWPISDGLKQFKFRKNDPDEKRFRLRSDSLCDALGTAVGAWDMGGQGEALASKSEADTFGAYPAISAHAPLSHAGDTGRMPR